jgi:hypothetical protein
MKGWIIVGELWHYVRGARVHGARTLCGVDVGAITRERVMSDHLKEMEPGLSNCPKCQSQRISEIKADMRG